jgi:hypothetical protein
MISAAAPEGTPPWRFGNEKIERKPPCSAVPRRGPEAESHHGDYDFADFSANPIGACPICRTAVDLVVPDAPRDGSEVYFIPEKEVPVNSAAGIFRKRS